MVVIHLTRKLFIITDGAWCWSYRPHGNCWHPAWKRCKILSWNPARCLASNLEFKSWKGTWENQIIQGMYLHMYVLTAVPAIDSGDLIAPAPPRELAARQNNTCILQLLWNKHLQLNCKSRVFIYGHDPGGQLADHFGGPPSGWFSLLAWKCWVLPPSFWPPWGFQNTSSIEMLIRNSTHMKNSILTPVFVNCGLVGTYFVRVNCMWPDMGKYAWMHVAWRIEFVDCEQNGSQIYESWSTCT